VVAVEGQILCVGEKSVALMDESNVNTRRAYGLVVAATTTYVALMFVWFSVPAYLSVVAGEVGLSSLQAGLLVGAVPLTYVPLALFSGIVVDRKGPGVSLAAGTLLFGGAQVGRSAATEFLPLFVLTVVVGVGATTITFGLPKLVSLLFPPTRTGFPSTIYLVGASAGSALVFSVGRPVLGPMLGGWRPLFLWSGVATVLLGVGWYAVARSAGVDALVAGGDALTVEGALADLRHLLTHRELQLVVVIGSMYLLVTHSLQGWLPVVLESRGLSAGAAGETTALFVVAIALGTFVVPTAADRLSARRLALVACGGTLVLGITGIVVGGVGPLLLVAIVVVGVGTGGISAIVRAIPPELDGVGVEFTGAAVGFIFAVGEVGGFLGPVAIGTLHDWTGSYVPGLGLLALAGVVVVVAGGALVRRSV
jgi:cyanate permease